ncbi:MAG TPA: TonB-dependent receptor [Steroidobacteraceae bacterium]|nr:TonB-dependent receptor [Steroidobacteraceae bacterium]
MSTIRRTRNASQLLSASPLALTALLAPPAAVAQSAGQDPQLTEIVVTGLRQSIQTSQEIKQNAEVIVDSISAVDISALPDRSVTEALQRISGVAIDHLFAPSDTNRFSAEGSGVTVRGLTQVRSELNGRDVFSARNTRGLSFEDVPAELMAGVDVYKNPSADMIEGGIAGTVNLRTRKPLDHEGFTAGLTGSANFGDFSEELKPQASLLLSNAWETDHGTFGALIDVAYSELATRTDSIQFGRPFRRNAAEVGAAGVPCEDMSTGASMNCVFVPAGARWSELDFNRERRGFDVALQWKTDHANLWLNVLQSDYKMNWIEHSAWLEDSPWGIVPAAGTSFTFDSQGAFESGQMVSNSWIPDWTDYLDPLQTAGARMPTGSTARAAEQHQKTTDYSFTAEIDATERLSFSGDVQYVKATADNYDYTLNTQVNPSSLSVSLTGELPSVSANPGGYLDEPQNFFWAAGMDDTQQNEATQLASRLSLSFAIDSGWFQSIKAGLRFAHREATNRDTGYNWQPISQWWQGDAQGNWPGHLAGMDQYLTDHSTLFDFSDFFRGDSNLPGSIWVASDSMVRNLKGNAGLVQSALVNGSGWAPDTFRDGDINVQEEKDYAAFALLRFGKEFGSRTLDGNIGVRYVKTDYSASGSANQPDWSSQADLLNANGDPEFVAKWGSGAWLPNHFEDSYDDVLPSLNVRLKLTPDFQLRLAASKAIARPSLDQLTANITLGGTIVTQPLLDENGDPVLDENGQARNGSAQVTRFTGNGGNPLLKPMEGNQFDFAAEWYFAPQGSLYTTLFYKELKNYFIRGTAPQSLFGRDDWQVTTTVNGDEGLVKGFEIGYSQFYDSLPGWFRGLGAQANFTYVDSSGGSPTAGPSGGAATVPPGLPLEGLSKRSYNLVGLYQRGPVEARLAYNWRERWLLTTSDGDGKGSVWNDDYGQLDASIFVRFGEHLQVGLEGNNLTNTTQKLLVGPFKYTTAWDANTPAYNVDYTDNRLYQNAWFTFDRRFALTARLTF